MSGDQAAEDYMADGYASDEYFSDECIADEFLTGNNAAQHPFGENVSYTLSGKTLTLSGSGYVSRYCLPEELPFNVNDVEKLVINDGIEQLDSSLFEGYENLREVKIAGSVKVIGNSAFACWAGDSALEKVELEEGVEELGSSSFRGNKALKSIILPESLKVLGGGCFESTGLKSIEIPAGVEEIDLGVSGTPFNSCVDLTELTVSAENKKYDSRDGCNAVIETATDTLVAACRTTEIPESVTALGPMSYCNLFFEIWQEEGEHVFTVPGHIKKIGERAFGANLLDRIVLEEGIEEIDDLAFWNNNITKLEIPASVRYIGGGIIDIDEDEYEGVF
ncbi:MAG: leucine-rich repeat domain-containing protein, partial [Lachnospiraceae bacterium]|nr:leucine-rich repeat domain-containing protein [Lachnospiraceae bacterium]